jgi:hypothetical protein
LTALKWWCGSTSGHMDVFDRRGSTEVCNLDTVTSHLAFPKAAIGYYVA